MDYINSYDYAEAVQALTDKMGNTNAETDVFFSGVAEELTEILAQLKSKYEQQKDSYERGEAQLVKAPDDLSDTFEVPESLIDKNFEVYEDFNEIYTEYESNLDIIDDMIYAIREIGYKIGGIE